MRIAASLAALLLIQGAPCEHSSSGKSSPVDLDAIEAGYRGAARGLAVAIESIRVADPTSQPFDAGLPTCRGRGTRRVRVDPLPAEWVGKRIGFGPSARGDLWVVTSAKRLRDVVGALPASREIAARLGVRCVPALVTVVSTTEVELVEE